MIWTDDDVSKSLEHFYYKELATARDAVYSDAVLTGNFKRYLNRKEA